MATTQRLLSADEQIRASVAALGAAISAVPEYTPPALARAVAVEQNLYRQIDAEFSLLTSTQAGSRMGSRSRTPRNLASSARNSGRVIGIQRGQATYFPGFQFDAQGQPLLVISQLRRLGIESGWSETSIVHWLMSPTTQLDGQRPVDLLASAPEEVLVAARATWQVQW